MTTTYFNIEFTQFLFFHEGATGGNDEMSTFIGSLQSMSLTLSPDGAATNRRMLLSIANEPEYFLYVNIPIFAMMGGFLLLYGLIALFQRTK